VLRHHTDLQRFELDQIRFEVGRKKRNLVDANDWSEREEMEIM
jgi:hypothetical protein